MGTVVTVYSKPECHACRTTKQHLERRGIPYTEVMMDDDIAEAALYLGFTAVPVVCASVDGDEQAWAGYRPDRINALTPTGLAASVPPILVDRP